MASGRTLDDWLAYQEQLHPVKIELGLERVERVWYRLKTVSGDITSPVIVIGGTNGKGSTVAYVEQIYRQCGYSTLVYTSPHIRRYNERIRVNSTAIDDASLIDAFEQVERARGEDSLSYFEFGTLAALYIAACSKPDITILEVGLGGRLDAVNILQHDVAVVTNVSFDHMEWLGETLSAIAVEKAGIARAGRPLITGSEEMPAAYYEAAKRHGAEVISPGHGFDIVRRTGEWDYISQTADYLDLPMPAMAGVHQLSNAACAITAVERLQVRLPVRETCLRQGLVKTKISGRFERVSDSPLIYLDVAHNPAAASELHAMIAGLDCNGHRLALLAMQANRELAPFLRPLINDFDSWHVSALAGAAGHTADEIKSAISGLQPDVVVNSHASVTTAIESLKSTMSAEDCLVVFGSFYTVSEAVEALHV